VGTVTVYGGDIIYAADHNAALDRLDIAEWKAPRYYVKENATSRNTTTTSAADSGTGQVLAGISLEVGSYELEVIAFITVSTTDTQGFKCRFGFTGTANGTSCYVAWDGPASAASGNITAVTATNFVATQATGQDANFLLDNQAAYANVRGRVANFVVSAPGNLSFDWAQTASSGNNTTLREGSYLKITRYA
jgi:hypothetical protein